MDISIPVCQHVVQQQLHALRRREVFLPVVVDDRTQRAVDVIVAHALVIQQPCDALAHAALCADVFIVARLAARPADELAALLGEAHFFLQDCRRVRVIAVQLGVVELEGVHAPLAHARAVAPVDVLILIHAIDILFRVHGQRSVFQSFFNLLRVPLVAVLKKIHALARVQGVRFALCCALCGVRLCGRQITLAHALRALRRHRRPCGHGVLLPGGWRGRRRAVLHHRRGTRRARRDRRCRRVLLHGTHAAARLYGRDAPADLRDRCEAGCARADAARTRARIGEHFAVDAQQEFPHCVDFLLRAHHLQVIQRITHLVHGIHDGLCARRLLLRRRARVLNDALGVVVTLLGCVVQLVHVLLVAPRDGSGVDGARDRAEGKGRHGRLTDGVPVRRVVLFGHCLGEFARAGLTCRVAYGVCAAEQHVRQNVVLLSRRAQQLEPRRVHALGERTARRHAERRYRCAQRRLFRVVLLARFAAVVRRVPAGHGQRAPRDIHARRDHAFRRLQADLRRRRNDAQHPFFDALRPRRALLAQLLRKGIALVSRIIQAARRLLAALDDLAVLLALAACNGERLVRFPNVLRCHRRVFQRLFERRDLLVKRFRLPAVNGAHFRAAAPIRRHAAEVGEVRALGNKTAPRRLGQPFAEAPVLPLPALARRRPLVQFVCVLGLARRLPARGDAALLLRTGNLRNLNAPAAAAHGAAAASLFLP